MTFARRVLVVASVASVVLGGSGAEAQRPRAGHLVLEGDQPGAEVYVDAELVGTMPMDPLELSVGEHTLRVTRPGYTELTEVFRIRPRRRTQISVDLLPVSMALSVVTDPEGAQVFVDGRFSGETPLELDLLEGEHSVRVTRAGYHEVVRTVQAAAGQNETLDLELEELPAEEVRAMAGVETELEWYEKPLTWILVGGGAVAVAAGILLVVALTSEDPSQADQFCSGGMHDCLRVDPMF